MATLDFIMVDSFLDDINREDCFDTLEMDGESKNFKIVLASECPNDISKCVDAEGTLITPYGSDGTGVSLVETIGDADGLVSLLWTKGINGERTLSVNSLMASYDFGDEEVTIKGAFLVSYENGSGYVIAYAINNAPIIRKKSLLLNLDGMIWGMHYGQ